MALFLLRHCRNTGNLSENFSKYRLHAIQKEIRPHRPSDGNGFPSIQLPRNRFQIFLAFPAHNQSDIRQRVVVDEPIQLGTLLHGVGDRVLNGGCIDMESTKPSSYSTSTQAVSMLNWQDIILLIAIPPCVSVVFSVFLSAAFAEHRFRFCRPAHPACFCPFSVPGFPFAV